VVLVGGVSIAKSPLLTLFGFGILAISVVALWRTSFGKRFRRLPTVEKALTVIAATPGALMAFALIVMVIVPVVLFCVFCFVAASALEEHDRREEQIRVIEEGVRRAMKR